MLPQQSRSNLFLHWIPALIGIGVIMIESTATMSAANTSRWLLPIWVKLFGPISPDHWAVVHHYIRKSGHFVGYGTISLGFFHGWRETLTRAGLACRPSHLYSALAAILCTVLLASADEWHQSFLPGRTSSVYDVLLDFCGALTAHLLCLSLLFTLRRKQHARLRTASA